MNLSLSLSSVLAISTIAISSLSSTAFAKDGAFISGSFGSSSGQESGNYDSSLTNIRDGVSYGGAIGYNKNKWSFVASYDKRSLTESNKRSLTDSNLTKPATFDISIYLANAIYNFNPLANKIQFYIGGGVGMASTNWQNSSLTIASSAAVQLQGGVKYPVHSNVDLFADYRSTVLSDAAISGGTSEVGFAISSVNIGATYRF